MARRRSADQVDTETMLAAAAEVFAAEGFEGARVDEIATRAGVSKAMLYYRIGGKEALYLAVLESFFLPLSERMQEVVSFRGDAEQRLRHHIRVLVEHLQSHPTGRMIMMREAASGAAHLPAEVFKCMARVFGTLSEILAQGMGEGRFRPVNAPLIHFMLIGAINNYLASGAAMERARASGAMSADFRPIEDREQLVEALSRQMLGGLVSAPTPDKETR